MNSSKKKIAQKSSGKQEKKMQKKQSSSAGRGQIRSAPLASSRIMRTGVPDISGSAYAGDGRMRVRHREYIKDISGSVAFSASSLSINPGDSSTFPWLSVLAAEFESYLFRSLKFEFETQKSASTSGSLMLAVDFDAADSVPLNKQQLMAYHNAVRSAVWEECCYLSSRKDLEKFGVQRYVRLGSLAENLDIKTYDVGNLIVATQGESDTSAIGELYVEYDVELITPQISNDVSAYNSVHISSGVGATRALPFNAATYSGGLQVVGSASTLTFNKVGQYLVEFDFTGTVATATPPVITGTVLTSSNLVGGQFTAAGAVAGMTTWVVKVTDIGQTMIFDCTGACATLASSDTRISPYGYSNS